MSIDHQLELLLGNSPTGFAGADGSVRGQVSSALSDAGIVKAIRAGSDAQGAGLASLAAALGASLGGMAEELRTSNKYLASLEVAALTPLNTEARELHERGLHALSRGWYPEATDAFEAALLKNPLSFEICMGLGLAYQGMGELPSARAALAKAKRYSMPDAPAAGVGAMLLLAGIERDAGNFAAEVTVLREATSSFPHNAEALFRLAVSTSNEQALIRAVRLAPELAVAAPRVWNGDLTRVLDDLLRDERGPISKAQSIRENLDSFSLTFSPQIELRWVRSLSSPDKETAFLAAAETFDYLRNRVADLYRLNRYAIISQNPEGISRRTLLVRALTDARNGIPRQSAWLDPSRDADSENTGDHRPIAVTVRSSGLVVPGPPLKGDSDTVILSGETIGFLDRGDIYAAADLVRLEHPRISESGVVHMLTQVLKNHLSN